MGQLLNLLPGTLCFSKFSRNEGPKFHQCKSCWVVRGCAQFLKRHRSSEAVCNGGDSDVIPYVQTLRKFPKEELRAKVALVRFDSTIMLRGGQDQNVLPEPTSNALLTVKYLLEAGAKVILVSEWCVNLELESVADFLSSALHNKVVPVRCVYPEMLSNMESIEKADIFLVANLSEFKEEVANCLKFAEALALGVDIFVNDSFSQSHKILASTVGVTRFCCACLAGFNFEDSLCQLKKATESNKKPHVAIIGGGNLHYKAAALRFLASSCDGLVFVGMMSFQIMNALGLSVPLNLVEHGALEEALHIVQFAKSRNVQILHPKDFWCKNDSGQFEIFPAHGILDGWAPVDIGPVSLGGINSLLTKCKKILWIGPVKFHRSGCTSGATTLAQILDQLSQNNCEITVVGKMACEAIMKQSSSASVFNMVYYASVVWEFLKGRKLPGILALDRAYPYDIDWKAVYSDPLQPLAVDIGSGNGLFLMGMAKRRKDLNFLGLEINEKLVRHCLDSIQQFGKRNGYFISTNATSTFRSIVSSYPGKLVLVSIQCPNPDFNKPEYRWRMLQKALVEAVAELLVPNGKVFLQSDIEAVSVRMREEFLKYGKGKLVVKELSSAVNEQGWLKENPFEVRCVYHLGNNETALSARELFDNLANVSVGDLLSGVTQDMDANCIDPVSLSEDSFRFQSLRSNTRKLPHSVSFDHPRISLSENVAVREGEHGIASSTPIHIVPQQPAKKPTRQWAAWTRQEEESFFTALRQVGKNFEKITCRVQSKNKDQVRHYYYRLVRRMNKLLGPELCLDAKNSKDTNAAMLRWWSLLEKYSCKASKLHLKPRRFKIFIEALEHQLLKDRKKSVRKRPSQGENCPPAASTFSNQSRASGHDNRTFKLVLVDSQNIQKVGSGKASLKRNINIGINRNNKGDSTTMKPARQRRKSGVASSAAYKKWEKAAIAGVSLVADAAEHLERTATGKEDEQEQFTAGQESSDPVSSLPTFPQNPFVESSIHSSVKLKLQLFPIDDCTRRALELDKHNPHLELTLSNRKKISSVLEHLNRKWGSSTVASGELMLFPYNVQRENIMGHQRWTQDSIVSAADVYAIIGSPTIFRLRYGWFNTTELGSVVLQEQAPLASCCITGEHNSNEENRNEQIMDSAPLSLPSTDYQPVELNKDNLTSVNKTHTSAMTSNERKRYNCAGDGTIMRHLRDANDLRNNGTALSAGEWADSLTNISVGDLLSGVSQDMDANCIDPPVAGSSQCLQQIPFSCDSFDAAIAAHISRQQDKMGCQATLASHASSILDAEETCDAFSFQKNPFPPHEAQNLSGSSSPRAWKLTERTSLVGSGHLHEELPEVERVADDPAQEDPMDECRPDPHLHGGEAKDFNVLADIYWPDSLGPLDLDMPSSKYHSEDIILSDSLSGLNRLIASSMDAFQNCSFFGLDKKEAASTVEARETASWGLRMNSDFT
ncbi:hypothetical protein FNV43_RR15748 [Rhamnella rubrinervis]|uniref:Phosphoglycerate kinase n=1 Tax=Rhamnella rubrinervis TaxID=2594499 RepID=A0A8K0E753_9ROSA|nr:hypothetical protein FNV43_RR15748 [Rhamnella rubrinervis]